MLIEVLKSKIHRATVTEANLNYIGSITIDKELLEASGIREYEKVQVVNITNGERFETYAITGKKGQICMNGGTARLACEGDIVVILAYALIDSENSTYPLVIHVNEKNEII